METTDATCGHGQQRCRRLLFITIIVVITTCSLPKLLSSNAQRQIIVSQPDTTEPLESTSPAPPSETVIIDICSSQNWTNDILSRFQPINPYESFINLDVSKSDSTVLLSEIEKAPSAVMLVMEHSISFDESLKFWNILPDRSLYIQKVDDIQSIETMFRYLLLTQWYHAVFYYKKQQHNFERLFIGDVLCSKCGCIVQREMNDIRDVKGIEDPEGEFYRIAKTTKTDKVSKHKYHILYDKTMSSFYHRNQGIFLEIGFGCGMAYGAGESAKIWTQLFNAVHFVEYDGECIEAHREDIDAANYTVHVGDQADVVFLEEIKSDYFLKHPHGVDIIIDDGGHWNHQILKSFGSLWHMVNPNGLYYIEDYGESAYDRNYHDSRSVSEFGTERPGTAAYFISNLLYNLFCRVTGKSCFDIASIEARLDIAVIQKI